MANDWEPAYAQWQQTQDANDLHSTVHALSPVLQRSVTSIGAADDPAVMSKAKLLAAGAIKSYTPEHGASLPTWVAHSLTPLRRYKRLSGQTLQVPERIQLDAFKLNNVRKQFADKHDREPDQIELGDAALMSPRRLKEVQRAQFSMPGENAMEGGTSQLLQSRPDFSDEAMDYVYGAADYADRAIMEGRMGYNGTKVTDTPSLLQRTKLSPFQLSRRAGSLAMRIQKVLGHLEGSAS
jgi:hypothetical protein